MVGETDRFCRIPLIRENILYLLMTDSYGLLHKNEKCELVVYGFDDYIGL